MLSSCSVCTLNVELEQITQETTGKITHFVCLFVCQSDLGQYQCMYLYSTCTSWFSFTGAQAGCLPKLLYYVYQHHTRITVNTVVCSSTYAWQRFQKESQERFTKNNSIAPSCHPRAFSSAHTLGTPVSFKVRHTAMPAWAYQSKTSSRSWKFSIIYNVSDKHSKALSGQTRWSAIADNAPALGLDCMNIARTAKAPILLLRSDSHFGVWDVGGF